jgi:hypothetical protein
MSEMEESRELDYWEKCGRKGGVVSNEKEAQGRGSDQGQATTARASARQPGSGRAAR